MRLRPSTAFWTVALWVIAVSFGLGTSATYASHRHHPHASAEARARAAHLERLASHEKAAWRLHLARLRDLPRHQRLAIKKHDRRYKHQVVADHQARVAHLIRLAGREKSAWHVHLAKLARREAHVQRLAQRSQRLNSRHQVLLAAKLSSHEARARAHEQALAQNALAKRTRLAKRQILHNARLATARAHWVALHGDGSGGHSIRFWQTKAAGVPVKCITVDLNDSNIKVSAVMALHGAGTAEPFRRMIERADPNVAVTGTFFSLDNLEPVGDIVIDGSLIHFGGMGTALCITPNNRAHMIECTWGRHHDWSPYDFVVACGPRLLHHGRIVLDPAAERFHDRYMLAPNSRIAVGITRGNKIVFVMTHKPIYLGRLAKVMRAVGASEAMNLDAGVSNGFYYNGAILARPGRRLTNMIVVYRRRSQYEHALPQLIPASDRRMDSRYSSRRISQTADLSSPSG
jgi:hypothetical protein